MRRDGVDGDKIISLYGLEGGVGSFSKTWGMVGTFESRDGVLDGAAAGRSSVAKSDTSGGTFVIVDVLFS